MELKKLEHDFSICKITDISHVDFGGEFVFLAKTDDEISLVIPSNLVPRGSATVEDGWRGFKIAGVLDFGLVGVIAKISGILSEAGISVFVVSTFNTDYIFVKAENFDKAAGVLVGGGFDIK